MLRAGTTAPDPRLTSPDGEPVQLSSAWADDPALLVFIRHFGCVFCRQQVVDLRSNEAKLRALGVNLALVTMGEPAETADFVAKYRWPGIAFCDPDRVAYRGFELTNGSLGQLAGPGVAFSAIKATVGGTLQGRVHGGDPKQMPGLFIVGTDGVIRYAHEFKHAGDQPPSRDLMRIIPAALERASAPA
ncbi:MAG TPA: peroxiredoxin-like family protein [Tepidiformaceae bacterium]|nr:peroxiredoxin-like family protein [Tepidiformaceae bacterium]